MAQSNDPVTKLNELLKGMDWAVLTTVRPDDTLHSCPMATKPADAEGVLWFLSDSTSQKVEAIRTNEHVNLAYSDPAGQRYISVTGRCQLVRDHVKTRELWTPAHNAWFPKGLEDPDLILLKVLVQEVEYWEAPQGRMVRLGGFQK